MGKIERLLIVFALLALIIVFVAELSFASTYTVTGTVVDVIHTSREVTSGIANDKPVIVTTGEDAWKIYLLVGDTVKVFDVSPQVYYAVSVGDTVSLECRRGAVLGYVSDCKIERR